MPTDREIQTAKDYDKILSLVQTRKDQIVAFDELLTQNTVWRTAPASSKTSFHSCFDGGLVTHSIMVTKTLIKLRNTLDQSIPLESCAIVGLYHDIGKVGTHDHPMYIPQLSKWHRETLGQLYTVNEAGMFLDVPTRSLSYLLRSVELTEDEIQAIRYHDGQYCDENHCVKNKEGNLTRLLHMADSWSAGVLEKVQNGK